MSFVFFFCDSNESEIMHTHTYTHTGMEGAINQMPHSVIKFIETAANADNDNGDGAKGSWPVNCQFDCLSACECE